MQLSDAHLSVRGVRPKYAEEAGLKAVDAEKARRMGFPYAYAGIVIPYLNPFTQTPHQSLMRIRYFEGTNGGKPPKFAQPKGSPIEGYFDPHVDWVAVSQDTGVPIHFVEGEIKALAMNQRGFVTIGLGGVDSFGGAELTEWLRAVLK
jgi:hypothetical protein